MMAVADRHAGGIDRNRDLKLIHIAKKQLAMTDDAYRAVVLSISNQRASSSADLSGPERQALLNHLKHCGFQLVPNSAKHFPDSPQWRLVWSLWQQLADSGKVRSRSAVALTRFVIRQTGVDAMQWVTPDQLHAAIEALKDWLER